MGYFKTFFHVLKERNTCGSLGKLIILYNTVYSTENTDTLPARIPTVISHSSKRPLVFL